MFLSDNIGSMNVTTTLFRGQGRYLTLVTLNDQPWDFVESATGDDAKVNHLAMILACGVYLDSNSGRPAADLN